MRITNRIDKDLHTVFVEVAGEVSVEDLMCNKMKIIDDPDYRKNFNMLLDLSKATPAPSVNLDKVKMSKKFAELVQFVSGDCRWAVCAPGDDAYAFSSMYAALSSDLKITTGVFRNIDEAREWLGLEERTPDKEL